MTLALFTAILSSYQGQLFTESLSYFVNDGWCDYKTQGIGIHCFGDFGTLRSAEPSVDLFLGVYATNHPLILLLGSFYRLLPYTLGALINSLLLLSALIIPLIIATKSLQLVERIGIVVLFGIWNVGTISTIDRGNHIGFVILIVFLYLNAVQNEKWQSAVLWLALLACFKWWGCLFVIPLLALKKWGYAVRSGVLTIVITFASLGFFPGSLLFKIERMFTTITDRDLGASLAKFSISVNTLWIRVGCLLQSRATCDPSQEWANGVASTAAKIFLMLVVLGLFWGMIQSGSYGKDIGIALLPLLGIVAIPEAQLYNTALMIVTISLLLQSESSLAKPYFVDDKSGAFRKLKYGLGIMSTVAIAPISWRTTGVHPLSVFTGINYEFRIQYLTVPTSGLIMLIAAALWTLKFQGRRNANPSENQT